MASSRSIASQRDSPTKHQRPWLSTRDILCEGYICRAAVSMRLRPLRLGLPLCQPALAGSGGCAAPYQPPRSHRIPTLASRRRPGHHLLLPLVMASAGWVISRASSRPACCPPQPRASCLLSLLAGGQGLMAPVAIGALMQHSWARSGAGAQARPRAEWSAPVTHERDCGSATATPLQTLAQGRTLELASYENDHHRGRRTRSNLWLVVHGTT